MRNCQMKNFFATCLLNISMELSTKAPKLLKFEGIWKKLLAKHLFLETTMDKIFGKKLNKSSKTRQEKKLHLFLRNF